MQVCIYVSVCIGVCSHVGGMHTTLNWGMESSNDTAQRIHFSPHGSFSFHHWKLGCVLSVGTQSAGHSTESCLCLILFYLQSSGPVNKMKSLSRLATENREVFGIDQI